MRLGVALFVIACGSPQPHSSSPRATPVVVGAAIPCADQEALNAHANTNTACTITGTYSLKQFRGKGNQDLGSWPIVTLADGSEVMLESIWDSTKRPDDATVARFRGKTVTVKGTLHSSPPREMPANFFHWTLSPVSFLEVDK